MNTATVATLRRHAERHMPDRAVIFRRALVSDGGGGHTESWTVVGDDVPCALAPVASRGAGGEVGGRVSEESTHLVTLPAKQDVEEPDVVEVEAVAYEVTAVRKRGQFEVVRRVEVKESPDGVPEI